MASKEALRRALLAAQERFLDVVRGLGPDDLALPTENPDWTVHDVLAHLASAERGLLTTIERVRRGEPVAELVRYFREQAIDLAVVATHALKGWTAFWEGSLTPRLLSQWRGPALLVRVSQQTSP